MDTLLESFIESLKREKVKAEKGLTIIPSNFEDFKAEIKNEGKLNLKSIASLYEWTKNTLHSRAYHLSSVIKYHPLSPKFWMKKINKPDDHDGKIIYSTGLDLEDLMESSYRKEQKSRIKSIGRFIPDNYELAKKVCSAFNKKTKNKYKKDIFDNSFRETALWESENLEAIKCLSEFIQKNYVAPYLKNVLKSFNAKDVKFTEKQVEFVY